MTRGGSRRMAQASQPAPASAEESADTGVDGSLTTPSALGDQSFVAHLDGDVGIERRDELDLLVRDFRESRLRDAELDVTRVSFIDSSGLSALLTISGVAANRGGELRLLGPGRQFRRVLDISGVGSLCTVVPAEATDEASGSS